MDFIIVLLIVILLIIITRIIIQNQQKIQAPSYLKKTLNEIQEQEQIVQNTTEAQNELVDKLKGNLEEIIEGTKIYVISPLVDMGKNPVFWGSLSARIGLEASLKIVLQQSSRIVATRIIKNVSQNLALPFVKLAAKLGSERAAKIGIRVSAELAERAVSKIAFEAAQKAAQKGATSLGGKLAAKSATYASLGPIGAAMLAFDILSIGLDLGDSLSPNGPGYARMGTNELYFKIRDQLQKQLKEESGDDAFPIIVSPLDKLHTEQYQTFISLETSKIMDLSGRSFDPIILPFITAIRDDLISGELQQSELKDEAVILRYTALIDEDLLLEKVHKNLCISHGGINVLDSKGNTACSYASKEKCQSSYSDPLTENDTYVEWKNDQCILASDVLKQICKENKLPYNSEKGTCDITEEYCKTKGTDWLYNDKIQDYDCMINKGQEFSEALFGTTVTRGLKQTFDPQQYTKCEPGSEDLGYSCAKCNDPNKTFASITGNNTAAIKAGAPIYLAATGVGVVAAPVAYALTQTGFCFDKCKPGYRNALGVCWEDCNNDEVDDGAFCRKPLETYIRGAGRIPDKGGCDAGQRDDGTSCWDDLKCNTSCPGGGPWYNVLNCRTECSGSGSIKKDLFQRQTCNSDEDKVAALCYPKCKDGFSAATPTICSNGKGQTRAKNSYTLPIADLNYTIEFKKRQTEFSTKDN